MKLTSRHKLYIALASAGLVIVALLVGIAINQAYFSASGFVQQYLSALARHDAASALSMPGVGDRIAQGTDTTLLRGSALGEISDITIKKVVGNDQKTTVTASYKLAGKQAQGQFVLTRKGNTFGVFESWAFASPPLATSKVTVWHDAAFNVGNSGVIDLRSTPSGKEATIWGGTGTFVLFAPGNYVFHRVDKYLTAEDVTENISTPGETLEVEVDVQATPAFNKAVQKNVNKYLDECVKQKVLQPTGCPFGYETGNRIVGEPSWSIESYPTINITPGEDSWVSKDVVALLRITGEVQSLYDGTVSELNETVEGKFSVRIHFRADGSIGLILY